MKVDVAVVGNGPTGKVLSILLAQQGWSVAVIDRFETPYMLPRAVHFDHEIGRWMDRVGVGESTKKICVNQDMEPVEFRSGDGQVLMRVDPPDNQAQGWPERNFFHQPELEQLLADRANKLQSLHVLGGNEAIDIREDEDSMDVTYRTVGEAVCSENTRLRHIQAKYVVGCDGAKSLVSSYINSPVHDLGFRHDWLVVDFVRKGSGPENDFGWQCCDPNRPSTYIPLGPTRVRMEFMLKPEESPENFKDINTIWTLTGRHGLTPDNANITRSAVYTFRALWLERWQNRRVFVAGDAAHLTPPFLGQGLCAGIRDAATLAWKLDMVLGGRAAVAMLDTYQTERIPHAASLIRNAVDAGAVICVTDVQLARERDRKMLEQGLKSMPGVPKPKLGPGVLAAANPNAGYLFPQCRIERDGHTIPLDLAAGMTFILLGMDHDPLADLSPEQRIYLDDIGVCVLHAGAGGSMRDIDGTCRAWCEQHQCNTVLIRPDSYVFATANTATEVLAMVITLRAQLQLRPD